MKNTRLEILKDEKWVELILFESKNIKYNKVINKISKVEDRSISHTNTFSIPNVSQNVTALDLNVFNPYVLSGSLNRKYESRYFADDVIIQEGFLVINNTKGGSINVNFIDAALSIVEKWGSITYNELLNGNLIGVPQDYVIAIEEMKNYQMPINQVLDRLSLVGNRGYKMALFPNNLNTIGDGFQLDENDLRLDNTFNPYQSRPVFNAKAFFDLVTESFGYTPIYDDSVDWDNVALTYIVSNELNKNTRDDGGILNNNFPLVSSQTNRSFDDSVQGETPSFAIFGPSAFPENVGLRPNDISQWNLSNDPINGTNTYADKYTIFVPELSGGNVGEITFDVDSPTGAGRTDNVKIYGCWYNSSNTEVLYRLISETTGSASQQPITINKTEFNTTPSNSGAFIGVILLNEFIDYENDDIRSFLTQVSETFLIEGTVSYDDNDQFIGDQINLTYAAPRVTIKKLLSGLMHKEGILLNIDDKKKEINYFSYGAYEDKKNSGIYNDFSKYFRRNEIIEYNTNFGNFYGILNRIGLSEPYLGNTFDIKFSNIELSKYKEFNEDYVTIFKDVENILSVNNSITPYFEYKNLGLGLVEQTPSLGELTQVRSDGSSQGQFTGLETLSNVNYLVLPNGINEWYNLIKNAVGVKGKFLLPLQVFRGLDISIPIYVSELGGYYIIEEVAEYENAQNMVTISLIKLTDNIREQL